MNKQSRLISLKTENHIAVMTIQNRPLNVLTDHLLDELEQLVDSVLNDREVRAIILDATGERAFAAGADIKQFPDLNKEKGIVLVEKGKKIFDKLAGSRAPVICSIHGMALGAGLELALACDIRIAEEDAQLGFPETGLGILPGYGGTQRLSRLVGPGKAKEMILSGAILSGREAYETGLVERLTAPGEAIVKAKGIAESIAAKAPLAVAHAKDAIDRGFEQSLANGQGLETQLFAELCETADMQEGVKAFKEKRKPEFKGK